MEAFAPAKLAEGHKAEEPLLGQQKASLPLLVEAERELWAPCHQFLPGPARFLHSEFPPLSSFKILFLPDQYPNLHEKLDKTEFHCRH